MLHIPFYELMRRSEKQMLTGQSGFRMDQCHRILQLVTEPVGTAGLIKPCPAPKTTTERLVE